MTTTRSTRGAPGTAANTGRIRLKTPPIDPTHSHSNPMAASSVLAHRTSTPRGGSERAEATPILHEGSEWRILTACLAQPMTPTKFGRMSHDGREFTLNYWYTNASNTGIPISNTLNRHRVHFKTTASRLNVPSKSSPSPRQFIIESANLRIRNIRKADSIQ